MLLKLEELRDVLSVSSLITYVLCRVAKSAYFKQLWACYFQKLLLDSDFWGCFLIS